MKHRSLIYDVADNTDDDEITKSSMCIEMCSVFVRVHMWVIAGMQSISETTDVAATLVE